MSESFCNYSLVELKVGENKALQCGHVFHRDCIYADLDVIELLAEDSKCPVCKITGREMTSSESHNQLGGGVHIDDEQLATRDSCELGGLSKWGGDRWVE